MSICISVSTSIISISSFSISISIDIPFSSSIQRPQKLMEFQLEWLHSFKVLRPGLISAAPSRTVGHYRRYGNSSTTEDPFF